MKASTVAISLLSVLLVGSNLVWAYTVFDAGISHTYLEDSYYRARSTAKQAIAVISAASNESATRQSVIDAAARVEPGAQVFEKEGFVWVGDIGLRFSDSGRLVEAQPATDPL
jgi:hypothetical protein